MKQQNHIYIRPPNAHSTMPTIAIIAVDNYGFYLHDTYTMNCKY